MELCGRAGMLAVLDDGAMLTLLKDTQAELTAFQNRPPRTAEQWLVELGAVPVDPVSSSSSSSSSSDDDDDDHRGDGYSADGSPMNITPLPAAHLSSPPPTIAITPTPAARLPRSAMHLSPTPAPRRRIPGLPRRMVLGPHGIGMQVGTSNVTVEQRHVVSTPP